MFYLIEITNMKDGTEPKAVWDKNSLNDAERQFHQTLASAMSNENVLSCLCMIIDSTGRTVKKEYYVKDIEPEEE